MLKSLKPEVEAKELSLFIGTYSELEKENKGRRYTTPSFLNNAKGKRCPFCELGNHVASKCLKFTNAASRKHTLCRKGLCFICFKSDHFASSCNSKYECHKCNGKHHIRICTFEKSDDSSDQNNGQPDGATVTNFFNNRNNIILQTASAVVSNINNSETLTTHLMLDSGSQKSYILSELRRKLNLPKLRKKPLLIKTSGNKNFKCQNVDIPLNIVTSNKVITIKAICTPVICDSLSKQNVRKVSSNYNHLKDLKLADSSDKEIKNIEILID